MNIRREAADWVVVLQGEEVATQTLGRFRAWLLRSPAHVEAYLKAETVWLALNQVDAERRIDVDGLMRDFSNVVPLHAERSSSQEKELTGGEAGGGNYRRWRWAAGLAVVALLGLFVWLLQQPVLRLETGLGEQHTSVMEDGSVIEINTSSLLRVRYLPVARRVELVAGEAYFNVQKDSSRPFVVSVDGHDVTAVGTEFNVYKRKADTLVSVAEGVVEITARAGERGQQPILLSAGQQAAISEEDVVVSTSPERMDQTLAWRKNQLVSLGEPLQSVVEEINRYNHRKILLEDDRLAQRQVSGVFSVHSPELIVRFLERSASIEVAEAPDGSWLLSENASPTEE